jgi:hypothetical protein
MDVTAIVGLVLLALLAGAALPVLVQARASLRAWQRTAEEVSEVAGRVRRELVAFEHGGARVASALESVDELGRAALELRRTVKVAAAIGAAVGPAIVAATRAMRNSPAAAAAGGANGVNDDSSRKETHHEAA